MTQEILGYLRPDGQIGIRNKVAIIFTVDCSKFVAEKIHRLFPEQTQVFGIPRGCVFKPGAVNKIVALGKHSQYGGALVVGLTCEATEAYTVANRIAESGKPVEAIKIGDDGGDLKAIEKGSRMMLHLLQHTSMAERAKLTPADLIVGAECGGSDATSGIAANPAVGVAADMLIDAGGTFMHSEEKELMGCGDVLAARRDQCRGGARHQEPDREGGAGMLRHRPLRLRLRQPPGRTEQHRGEVLWRAGEVGQPAAARRVAHLPAAHAQRLLDPVRRARRRHFPRRPRRSEPAHGVRRAPECFHNRLRFDDGQPGAGHQGDREPAPPPVDRRQRRY